MRIQQLLTTAALVVGVASVATAGGAGVFVQKPLAVKGQNLSAISIGAAYTQSITSEFGALARMGWYQVQTDIATEGSLGYLAAATYRLPFNVLVPIDLIVGFGGNGFSSGGAVVGASAAYQLNSSAILSTSMTYNTNEDLDFSVQFTRELSEFKVPDIAAATSRRVAQSKVSESTPTVAQSDSVPVQSPISSATVIQTPVVSEPQKAVPVAAYTDIANHWAKREISWAASKGLFASGDRFMPTASLNRFAAEALLKRMGTVLGVTIREQELGQLGSIVTKREFVTAALKVVAKGQRTDVDTVARELKVPSGWTKDASAGKAVSRAEAATILFKLIGEN